MSSVCVLFLAANPRTTTRLALDEEMNAIQQRLRASGAAERFDLRSEWALRADELPAALMRHKPRIVHFSGHGTVKGELLLVGAQSDQAAPVSTETLQRLFKTLGNDLFCVVLNACFSDAQAEALAQIVPCAVGMAHQIGDAGAIAFAAGFYEALAFGQNLRVAFELGCTAIELAQQADLRLVPQLRRRQDVDPTDLQLFPTVEPTATSAQTLDLSRSTNPASLLPPAPNRIRMIQEARFPWQHKLSMPQIEDLLCSSIHGLSPILGLNKNFFSQPGRLGSHSPLKGPEVNQIGGLTFSVEHARSTPKPLQYRIELSQDGMLRLAEYIDLTEIETPMLNIKYVSLRIALFLIFSIRLERRLSAHPPASRRCILHEIAGVTCKVDDWATTEVLPGISAGLGLVSAPDGLNDVETSWMPLGGMQDGLSYIAPLTGTVLRELFYGFRSRGSERSGLVRPSDAQLLETIKRLYEDWI